MDQATPFAYQNGQPRFSNPPLSSTPQHQSSARVPTPPQSTLRDDEVHGWAETTRRIGETIHLYRGDTGRARTEFADLLNTVSDHIETIYHWIQLVHKTSVSAHHDDARSTSTPSVRSYSSSVATFSSRSSRTSTDTSITRTSGRSLDARPSSGLRNEIHQDAGYDNGDTTQTLKRLIGTPEATPVTVSSANASSLKFRCLSGEHPDFSTSDFESLRRHEMEQHVNLFCCASKKTVLTRETRSGRRCIFCEALEPNQVHFEQHKLGECHDNDEPEVFKRKKFFIDHLTTKHRIPGDAIPRLLKSSPWSSPVRKTAFSCGLCVGILFDTKDDQLSHLKREHVKNGQGMKGWDVTKIMRSLLHHPSVAVEWNKILVRNDATEESISWGNGNRSLRRELDLKKTTAENFASSAWDESVKDPDYQHSVDTNVPFPVMTGTLKDSPKNSILNTHVPSEPHVANPHRGMKYFHDYSYQHRDTQSLNGNDMMDHDGSFQNDRPHSLPLPSDSLSSYAMNPHYDATGPSYQVQPSNMPPSTMQIHTQLGYYSSLNPTGNPSSRVDQAGSSDLSFFEPAYWFTQPHEQSSAMSDKALADVDPIMLSSAYSLSPREADHQGSSACISPVLQTSATCKRKPSTQRSKVMGSERRPRRGPLPREAAEDVLISQSLE